MASNTFTREDRLLNSREYDKVFKKSVRASGRGLIILARANEEGQHPRLGLVVPKKVLKRAVWRNRVKRIIRESFRNSKDSLPNADLVVLARKPIGEINNIELRLSLQRLWQRIATQLQ